MSYGGRKRDNVWSYFTQINGQKCKRAVCKNCKVEMSALVIRMKDHISKRCAGYIESEDGPLAKDVPTSDEGQYDQVDFGMYYYLFCILIYTFYMCIMLLFFFYQGIVARHYTYNYLIYYNIKILVH